MERDQRADTSPGPCGCRRPSRRCQRPVYAVEIAVDLRAARERHRRENQRHLHESKRIQVLPTDQAGNVRTLIAAVCVRTASICSTVAPAGARGRTRWRAASRSRPSSINCSASARRSPTRQPKHRAGAAGVNGHVGDRGRRSPSRRPWSLPRAQACIPAANRARSPISGSPIVTSPPLPLPNTAPSEPPPPKLLPGAELVVRGADSLAHRVRRRRRAIARSSQ